MFSVQPGVCGHLGLGLLLTSSHRVAKTTLKLSFPLQQGSSTMLSQSGMSLLFLCLTRNCLRTGLWEKASKGMALWRALFFPSSPCWWQFWDEPDWTNSKQTSKHLPPPKKNPQVIHLSRCGWRKAKPREICHCSNEIGAYTSCLPRPILRWYDLGQERWEVGSQAGQDKSCHSI